ncbi:MAG: hypothetical protein JW709_02210 [Sedimentisphaerales bacterium]|nr:hypothetical protein [Sedimentisphaerales bacterium]
MPYRYEIIIRFCLEYDMKRLSIFILMLAVTMAVMAEQSSSGQVELANPAKSLQTGDIQLHFTAPKEFVRLVVFYGAGEWWLCKAAPRRGEHFELALYDYGADELKLRFYTERADGTGEFTNSMRLPVTGGRSDWGKDRITAKGHPVGFNLIYALDAGSEAKMLRAVKELAELGIKDFLVNFYYQNYINNLETGAFDRLLDATDELGCRVWFNTRELEFWGQPGYHRIGKMNPELAEKVAFTFVTGKRHYLKGAAEADDFNYVLSQLTLPHNDESDILYVRAYLYDPKAIDPLPTCRVLDDKEFTWSFRVDRPDDENKAFPKLTYKVKALPKEKDKVISVVLAVKTLNPYLVPPLWDDDYYEQFYLPCIVEPLIEFAKLKEHPSFQGIAPINEPTFTWDGGEMLHPTLERRWHEFLERRYSTLENVNRAFKRNYESFGVIPYEVRLIYAGAYHTGWSGRPGEKGMNSKYEIAKSLFREEIINLIYQRTIEPYRRVFPDKDYFQKFHHASPFSWYGLRMQQAHTSIRLPQITVMASDIYPLGFKEGKLQNPAEVLGLYMGFASYGALLGRGQYKPAWLAETDFGRYRHDAEHTALMTKLMLDAIAATGTSRTFLWCVSPWGNKKDNVINDENAYSPHFEEYPDRLTPGLLVIEEFNRENCQRDIIQPDYDVVLLAGPTDSILHGAWDYGQSVESFNQWTAAVINHGLQAAQGVLTPESCGFGRAVVVPGGYYLSEAERGLIRDLQKPVLILGDPYVTNPVDGKATAAFKSADDVYLEKTTQMELADGLKINISKIGRLAPPPDAQVLTSIKLDDNKMHPVFFRVENRWTFSAYPATPEDAARLVRYWFDNTR